jgi:hypothetical protein
VLGEEHPDTLMSMNNLAGTLGAEGDLARAGRLQEQVLAIRRRVLGEEHPDTLMSMNNLAGALWQLGEHGQAMTLMAQAARVAAGVLGVDHSSARKFAQRLAEMQHAQS